MPEQTSAPPLVVEGFGMDLLLTIAPDGDWALHAPRLSRPMVALALSHVARSFTAEQSPPAADTRSQLWDVLADMLAAIALADAEGEHRESTEDMHTAAMHLRAVIESL